MLCIRPDTEERKHFVMIVGFPRLLANVSSFALACPFPGLPYHVHVSHVHDPC